MKKPFVSFEHVLGANIAILHLTECGFNVDLHPESKEGDATIMIEESQFEKAKIELEEWKKIMIKR